VEPVVQTEQIALVVVELVVLAYLVTVAMVAATQQELVRTEQTPRVTALGAAVVEEVGQEATALKDMYVLFIGALIKC
jgi:hypothetical protein